MNEEVLEGTITRMARHKSVYGCVLCVENDEGTLSWTGAAGNIKSGDRYFLTSVSKLCITLLIMALRTENRIHLEDKVLHYLPGRMLEGLHVLDGRDYTPEITIEHLLSNTSGIPDYLSFRHSDGQTTDLKINAGLDEPLDLETVLDRVRKLKPHFKPGQKGKVAYSNTNYRLLGIVIENITKRKIGDAFQEHIFNELGLQNTYPFEGANDPSLVSLYYKSDKLHIPNLMSTVTAEGGIVSTAKETMIILKAFFTGKYFPGEDLEGLKKWKFIFFPFQCYFGVGLEKLWIPRIKTSFKSIKEVIGFWGSSGAFAFYNPDTKLYFTGTVNQSSGFGHGAAYNAIAGIIKSQL